MTPRRRTSNDEGSLLLALLLALMLGSLVILTTATVIAGLNKTRAARDLALSQQAASAAVDAALIAANLGQMPATGPLTGSGTTGPVTWTWTATPHACAADATKTCATVDITAQSDQVDRTFEAVLEELRVAGAVVKADGSIEYTAEYGTPADFSVWRILQTASVIN